MDLDLTDRVFIVTGEPAGSAAPRADVLVAEGARVVISGRSQDSLDAAVADLDVRPEARPPSQWWRTTPTRAPRHG